MSTNVNKIVSYSYDKFFKVIINIDPSCIFPFSHYIYMNNYKDYFENFSEALQAINLIIMIADPFVDLLVLYKILREHLVSSLTIQRTLLLATTV